MRVGIVTQPLEMNYGGIIQNWALQQVLRALGHNPITIDAYQRYSIPHLLYSYVKTWHNHRRGIKWMKYPRRYRGAMRNELMGQFIEEHIAKTRVMWHYKRGVVKRYRMDAIVVGSDQVWRVGYNENHIEDMYLKFAAGLPLKRVAYAASFGLDKWTYNEQQTAACAALAQQMDAISVREISGVDLCRDHLGVDACCTLDPTMLLDAEGYREIIDNQWDSSEPYLAVYCLDITKAKKEFFNRLAAERGLNVRYFSAGWEATLTVEQWLAMLKNASMVVTDSFHGMVFSILFSRDFYALCNFKRGNSRIAGLLKELGLEERMVSDTEPTEPVGHVIDWPTVHSRLAALRKESIDFLSRSL